MEPAESFVSLDASMNGFFFPPENMCIAALHESEVVNSEEKVLLTKAPKKRFASRSLRTRPRGVTC
jgi:hypothetical protein